DSRAGRGEREHDSPHPALWCRHRSRRDRAVELRGDLAVQVHGGGGDHPLARRTAYPILVRAQALDHDIVERVGECGRRRGAEGERGRLAGALGRATDQRETERPARAPAASDRNHSSWQLESAATSASSGSTAASTDNGTRTTCGEDDAGTSTPPSKRQV